MRPGHIRVPHNYLTTRPDEEVLLRKDVTDNPDTCVKDGNCSDVAYKRVHVLAKVTTATHMASCIATIIGVSVKMQAGGPTVGLGRVWRIASCWSNKVYNQETLLHDIAFDTITNRMSTSNGFERHYVIAVLIAVFFFLSALFQFMSMRSVNHKDNITQNKPQWFRYTEYSFSASAMIVAIFVSFGMLDSYLHVAVFTLTFLCMVIGLAADHLRFLATDLRLSKELLTNLRCASLGLHYIGWIPMIVVWSFLWLVVLDMSVGRDVCENPNGSELPAWVWAVVLGQFLLFVSFGYVQRMQFSKQFDINYCKIENFRLTRNASFLNHCDKYDAVTIGIQTERSFILLSLLAKSFLGWVVYSQVLMQ